MSLPSYPGSHPLPGREARVSLPSYPGSHPLPGRDARVSLPSYPGSHPLPSQEARVSLPSYPGSHPLPGQEARVSPKQSLARLNTHHSIIAGCRSLLLMTSLKLYNRNKDILVNLEVHIHTLWGMYTVCYGFKVSTSWLSLYSVTTARTSPYALQFLTSNPNFD